MVFVESHTVLDLERVGVLKIKLARRGRMSCERGRVGLRFVHRNKLV